MSLEKVMVAIGPRDEGHVETLSRTAAEIAGPAGATVVLFFALSADEYETALADLDVDADDRLSPSEIARRHRLLKRAVELLEADGIEYIVHGAVGDPPSTIIEETESVSADLLVIGGRGRSPAGKAMFGSTPQEVLLNATCPVVYVRRSIRA